MALLNATSINVPQISDLGSAFQNIGGKGLSGINSIYGTAQGQGASDAVARGLPPSTYNTQRLGTQQGLDVGNLESGMGGVLGNTLYQGALGNEQYQQQSQLANEIGNLNRPSTLQQIFQGIGAVGRPAAQLAGMFGGPGGGSSSGGGYAGSPLSLESGYGGGEGSNWGYGQPNPYNAFGGY